MRFLSVLILGLIFCNSANKAAAQEIVGLQEQIDSLKEEMIILQRKVYRDNTDTDLNSVSSSSAAVKLGEYDQIVRQMNGKIDELEFKIKTLGEKLETINKDMDVRFRLLEGKPIPAAQNSLSEPKKFDTAVASGAPKSIVGDTINVGTLKNLEPQPNPLSVDDLYKNGLEALRSNNPSLAEANFNKILNEHSNDKLAGNAQYWLGEVYYSTKDFSRAAVAFGKGYQNYKNGAKGADSLLKLGLSMAQLGKKAEACSAFMNLGAEFPAADASIKSKAAAEAKKLGCK